MNRVVKLIVGLGMTTTRLAFGSHLAILLGAVMRPAKRYADSNSARDRGDSIEIGMSVASDFIDNLDPSELAGTAISLNQLFADHQAEIANVDLDSMLESAIVLFNNRIIATGDFVIINSTLNSLAGVLIGPMGRTESIDMIDFYKRQIGELEDARVTVDPSTTNTVGVVADLKTVLETRRAFLIDLAADSNVKQLVGHRQPGSHLSDILDDVERDGTHG